MKPADWKNFWLARGNAARLDAFRLLLGGAMMLYFSAWWTHAHEWLSVDGFHLSPQAMPWMPVAPPMPPALLLPAGVLFFLILAAWTAGWKTRWTCPLALAAVSYVTLVDMLAAYTLNKMFMVSLAILSCVPHGRFWCLGKNPGAEDPPVWAERVLQVTLLCQYFFPGWSKIFFGDWLKDSFVLWSQVQGVYRTDMAAWLLARLPMGAWAWMQYAALTFELLSPALFISKRLRPLAFIWGAGFQIVVALTMHMLIYFSLQMMAFYVLFADPGFLLRFAGRGAGRTRSSTS